MIRSHYKKLDLNAVFIADGHIRYTFKSTATADDLSQNRGETHDVDDTQVFFDS